MGTGGSRGSGCGWSATWSVVSDDAEAWARFTALREGLAARGWIKHRNFEIVARFGTADQFEYVAEFVALMGGSPEAITSGTVYPRSMRSPISLGRAA